MFSKEDSKRCVIVVTFDTKINAFILASWDPFLFKLFLRISKIRTLIVKEFGKLFLRQNLKLKWRHQVSNDHQTEVFSGENNRKEQFLFNIFTGEKGCYRKEKKSDRDGCKLSCGQVLLLTRKYLIPPTCSKTSTLSSSCWLETNMTEPLPLPLLCPWQENT